MCVHACMSFCAHVYEGAHRLEGCIGCPAFEAFGSHLVYTGNGTPVLSLRAVSTLFFTMEPWFEAQTSKLGFK